MSNLVTIEKARRLKQMGFDEATEEAYSPELAHWNQPAFISQYHGKKQIQKWNFSKGVSFFNEVQITFLSYSYS